MVFSDSKLIGLDILEKSIDLENTDKKTLQAQTFKVQLTFDYHTKLCFQLLDLLLVTNNEFFESTQIGPIIDFIYDK